MREERGQRTHNDMTGANSKAKKNIKTRTPMPVVVSKPAIVYTNTFVGKEKLVHDLNQLLVESTRHSWLQ